MEDAGKTHLQRRVAIRKIDPEFLKTVETADPKLALVAAAVLAAQMGLAVFVAPLLPSWAFWGLIATVGALLAHMTFLGMHEAVHDHFFPEKHQWANWAAAFLVQMPLVIPASTKFKQFHLIHHARQATDFDPDEPSAFEERYFLSHPAGRVVWACTQFVWYLVRPLMMANLKPKWELTDTLCVATQVCTLGGCALYMKTLYGPEAWAGAVGAAATYLVMSVVFAMGPSPFSVHFLIDHRPTSVGAPFDKRHPAAAAASTGAAVALPANIPFVPTFNYYGFWNHVSYYVGYHTEHHDFPKVSGLRLASVHDRFRPIYNAQPCSESWAVSLWDFIVKPYTVKQLNRTDIKKSDGGNAPSGEVIGFGAKEAMSEGQYAEVDPDVAAAARATGAAGIPAAPASAGKAGGRSRSKKHA